MIDTKTTRTMSPTTRLRWILPLVAMLLVGSVHAKKNNPNIPLEFRPTDAAGAVKPPQLPLGTALSIEVRDDRRVDENDYLGTRTNGDDELFTLRSTVDVPEFVAEALQTAAEDWGLDVREDAPNRLVIELTSYKLHETNQAVGASYESEVRLAGRMELPDGDTAEIHKMGDAFRYGRKFSAANTNEVLSDALLTAFSAMLDDKRLWAPGSFGTASSVTPLSPEGLLDELLKLQEGGFDDKTIATFLRGQALTRTLTADDLRTWKAEGAKESWMQAAMRLPVL